MIYLYYIHIKNYPINQKIKAKNKDRTRDNRESLGKTSLKYIVVSFMVVTMIQLCFDNNINTKYLYF